MKQKLALARALLHHPDLVLLDEPTAGLDVAAAVAVREDLASLVAREGVTVLLTTHNMAEAQELCSQVAVIREGQLVTVGHPDELRARSGAPRVKVTGRGFSPEVVDLLRTQPGVAGARARNGALVLDLGPETQAAPLISLLVGAGAEIEEVRREKASLQEVFLTLTEEERT